LHLIPFVKLHMAEFYSAVHRLMRQRTHTENERNKSKQSAWGAILRKCANTHSELEDIPHVAYFNKLSEEQKKEQYEPYQKYLASQIVTVFRAHNAQKYDPRRLDEIEPGTELMHVIYSNPFQRSNDGESLNCFQRGGTTADNILRMTPRNVIVLTDKVVRKMHKNIRCNQFDLVTSYIHEGWPEELELPELHHTPPGYKGLVRLDIRAIFKKGLTDQNLLLGDDDPGFWVTAASTASNPTAVSSPAAASAGMSFHRCNVGRDSSTKSRLTAVLPL
jgi:hypothetical protein